MFPLKLKGCWANYARGAFSGVGGNISISIVLSRKDSPSSEFSFELDYGTIVLEN